MGEIEQPWVCTLSYVKNCKDYNVIAGKPKVSCYRIEIKSFK